MVRFTKDVDVWLKPTNQNRDAFLSMLLDLSYDEDDIRPMRSADFTEPQMIRLDFGPLDVMIRVHKAYSLHINDLREAKTLARRPKDLFDVLEIDKIIEERKKWNEDPSDQ